MIRLRNIVLGLALLLAGQAVGAPAPAPAPVLDHARRADGTRVIPDRFLRAWDPLTVFFRNDAGPAIGGPEDAPQRFVTLDPPAPGAWQWLSARVLQFRPAEPWQPLRRVHVTAAGATTTLVPLLPVPAQSGPADHAGGIADLDRIALTFPSPVDESALARLMTIDVRPQPGITADGTVTLTAQDFSITAMERASRREPQTYIVALHRPVPDGQVAILRLRLSDEPGLDTPLFETRLHSAVAFAFTELHCASGFGNSTTDGLRSCAPNDETAGAQPRGVELSFNAPPEALDVVHARDVLRVTPHVDKLAAASDTTTLRLTGAFAAATVYTLTIPDGSLHDTRGRALAAMAPLHFAFAAPSPTLRWDASQGIVERFGPQMLPMRGQGYTKADLRIHPIDNASRDFWPFPQTGLITGADTAPPLPGREPAPWDQPGPIGPDDLALRLAALGSPSISTLADLPASPSGLEEKFGLDVRRGWAASPAHASRARICSACGRWMRRTAIGCACRSPISA